MIFISLEGKSKTGSASTGRDQFTAIDERFTTQLQERPFVTWSGRW
jgi:hypothetical protein